jgi:GDP-L-fucose synthase
MTFSLEGKRVWVAGHRGMVGSALMRALRSRAVDLLTANRRDLDLRRQAAVEDWMQRERPQVILLAAATVGGIWANATRPAEFLYNNIAIQANIIHAAYTCGVEKMIVPGSTCIYPKMAEQPIREETLLTGPLEPTNEWYALAKIAGLKMAAAYRVQYGCDFISAMPTNLYGQNDNFDLTNSHVLPALIRRIHEAKIDGRSTVTLWGTGTPRRDFLHVDDLADALLFLVENYSDEMHINVGTGKDVSISELAQLIAGVIGYQGKFDFDCSKPDGTPVKITDITRLASMGWRPKIDLRSGIERTYEWFLANRLKLRVA